MTEDDIARIAERERQEALKAQEQHGEGVENSDVKHGSDGASSTTLPVDSLVQPDIRPSMEIKSTRIGGSDSPAATLSKPRLLLGVPVVAGPNITKFLYAEVPKGDEEGHHGTDGENGDGEFNAEEAAARLCKDLHGTREEGVDFAACVSTIKVALTSR